MPNLTFSARIYGSDLKPITEEQVRIVEAKRRSNVLLTHTLDNGVLSTTKNIPASGRNIEVVIQKKIGRTWRTISDPISIRTGSSYNLGTIVVTAESIALREHESYGINLEKIGNEITSSSKKIKKLTGDLNAARKKAGEITAAYNREKEQRLKDIKQWKTKHTQTEEALAIQAQTANRLSNEKQELVAVLAQERASKAAVQTKLDEQIAKYDQLSASLATIESRRDEAIKAKEVAVQQLEKERAKYLERIGELEATIADARTIKPIMMESVGTSIGSQLMKTQSDMEESNAGFKVGKVSMELKCIPLDDAGEMKIGFLDLADIAALPAGSLSTVTYEYIPGSGEPESVVQTVAVPNVAGYTEIMATRELERAGFFVETSFQAVDDEGRAGTVVRQLPAKETMQDIGSVVRIFIGKLVESGG